LSAIFPIPKTPTFVIIQNGNLKEYVAAGVTKDVFLSRVVSAFQGIRGGSGTVATAEQAPIASPSGPAEPVANDIHDEDEDDGYVYPRRSSVPSHTSTSNNLSRAAASSDRASTTQSTAKTEFRPNSSVPGQDDSGPAALSAGPEQGNSTALRTMMQERAARIEAELLEQDEKEENRLETKGKGKAPETSDVMDAKAKHASETRKHAEILKKKRSEAQEEKDRIRKKIEDDKAHRKLRAAERAALLAEPKLGDVAAAIGRAASSSLTPNASGKTALQVRLPDNSIIRSRFDSKDTIRSHVRRWIDEKREDRKEPYILKAMITTTSTKIEETDEDKSLQELGLAPSATLVLVPIRKYSRAYDAGASANIFHGALQFLISIYAAILAFFTGIFSGKLSREEQPPEPQVVRQQRQGRFAQFANPDDQRREQQLYNGNSVCELSAPIKSLCT
jgi:hypothetical protein